jgi:hypothetical protein
MYTVSFGEPCKPLGSSSFPRLVGHIIDDVTAAIRVGAVPSVLQWQYRRLVYYAFATLKYLSKVRTLT